ncbi:MAG TPA: hypothetical protein VGL44_11785 [Gaiellales bacterium]
MNPATIAIASALVLVPGFGATLAAYPPGRVGPATRLALTFGLGYAVVGITAVLLVIVHVLQPATFFPALAIVTVALWGAGLRRGGLRAHRDALVADIADDGWGLAIGALVFLAIAIVRLRSSPLLNFEMFGPWRYWADGLEIADAGKVPAQTLQWGTTWTPTVSKVVLNSYHAALSYAIGRAPLPAMGALLWVASTGLAAGLWALGRELGLRRLAPLLPLLTLAVLNDELRRNLDVYTAENVGRMVAVCALVLAVRALRDRDGWKEPALAALLFGAGFATHGVPVVALMVAMGWYAVARGLLDRAWRPVLLRLVAIAATAAALTLVVLLGSGGSIGFQGASGASSYSSFGRGVDPTASLLTGTVRHTPAGHGHWYVRPAAIMHDFTESATTLKRAPAWLVWLLPIVAVAAAVLMLRRFPAELAPLGLVAAGSAATLLAIAFLFSYRYRTQIPGRFGIDREFDYVPLVLLPAALALGEAAVGRLRAVRAWIPIAVVLAAIAVPAVAVAATVGPSRTGWQQNGRASVAVLDWVDEHEPCGARILPDRVTLGTFAAATGRVSVVEGMGPYLRPAMLHTVLRMVLQAHRFFEHPASGGALLRRLGVSEVLVVKGVRIGSMVGVLESGVDPAAFRHVPYLRLVHSSPLLDVYHVRGSGGGSFPDPATMAGFHCQRGAVPGG